MCAYINTYNQATDFINAGVQVLENILLSLYKVGHE